MQGKASAFVAQQSLERYPERRKSFQESLRSYDSDDKQRLSRSPVKHKINTEERTTEKKAKRGKKAPLLPAVKKIAKKADHTPTA